MTLAEVVQFLNQNQQSAELIGNADCVITQVAALTQAEEFNLSFFSDPKRKQQLLDSKAGAVLLTQAFADSFSGNKVIVENPYYCYALIAQFLNPVKKPAGISDSAVIAETAELASSVTVGANAVIESAALLEESVSIGAGCYIGENVTIGKGSWIAPNVTIMHDCVIGEEVTIESGAVIGGEGFGNANHKGEWLHIPQLGRVVIGSRVWIANNVSIDRGALEDTIIEDNCVIDNLVHIAHNVKIGYGSAITGQVGFAGSTTVGKYCSFGGQAGIAGHLTLADNSHYFAKAGVTHSIKEAGTYSGFPAVPVKEWQKATVKVKGLDKLTTKVKDIEKQLKQLNSDAQSS